MRAWISGALAAALSVGAGCDPDVCVPPVDCAVVAAACPAQCPPGGGGSGSGGGASTGLASLLGAATFDSMFLHDQEPACHRVPFDHASLLRAAATFPRFANEGTLEDRKRELAAFLAQISHETTGGWPTAPDGPYAWGLCFGEELACVQSGCSWYCSNDPRWPCRPGESYHGRGPMQLSWSVNYGQAGDALSIDLLGDPERVARDGEVGWRTALWFWMTPQAPKPSAHDVMVGLWQPSSSDQSRGRVPGFGMTTNIINGGIECGRPAGPQVLDRIGYFERYASMLGVSTGANLECDQMRPY